MMSFSPLIIVVYLIILLKCTESYDCSNKASAKTATTRLRLDLLCNYDKYARPVPYHTNKTAVTIILAPRIIDFDDARSTLHLKAWLSMSWKDHHLSWDKLQYDEIDQLILDTSMIWVPDLSIYNTRDDTSLDQLVSPVMVDYHGLVYSFMSPELAGHCIPNWANWPFDVHVCIITLGSKRYLGSTVDFQFLNVKKGVFIKYLLPNKDWELLDVNTTRNETRLSGANDTNPVFLVSLNYQFIVRRHASVYIASYLIPGIVMAILSLGLLWIPSNQVERTAIICTLVVIQSLFLQYLAYKIPSNGDTTPYLVCFYRDCLAITGILAIETIVTRSMSSWNSNSSYLQKIFQIIAGNKVLQFVFMNDMDPKNAAKLMDTGNEEGSTLVHMDGNVHHWQLFVNIVNKTFFIVLVPIYLLLSISLLPLNYSFSPN